MRISDWSSDVCSSDLIIQAVHRIQRYGQTFHGFRGERPAVRLDFIYTEAERGIRRAFEDKWRRYEEQAARMSDILREYGLAHQDIAGALQLSSSEERRVGKECVRQCSSRRGQLTKNNT